MTETIIRLPALMQHIGLSKSAIYAAIQRGEFPKPIPLGKNASGWLSSEVQAWIESRRLERDAA